MKVNKKTLKEKFTMFRPDSREQALDWIDSEIEDAKTIVGEIYNEIEDVQILEKLDKLGEIQDNIKMLASEGLKLDEHRINPKATPVGPGKGIDYTFREWAKERGLAASKEGDYSKAIGHVGADVEIKIVLRSTQRGDAVYLDVYSDGEQVDQFKSDTLEEYKNDLVEIARSFVDYGKGITPIRENKKSLREHFEWSSGDDTAEAEALLNDMEFIASLEGYNDEEIREAVADEIAERYNGGADDIDWDAFESAVVSEFMRLFNSPIVPGEINESKKLKETVDVEVCPICGEEVGEEDMVLADLGDGNIEYICSYHVNPEALAKYQAAVEDYYDSHFTDTGADVPKVGLADIDLDS